MSEWLFELHRPVRVTVTDITFRDGANLQSVGYPEFNTKRNSSLLLFKDFAFILGNTELTLLNDPVCGYVFILCQQLTSTASLYIGNRGL